MAIPNCHVGNYYVGMERKKGGGWAHLIAKNPSSTCCRDLLWAKPNSGKPWGNAKDEDLGRANNLDK
jgi:hypothetical protein